MKKKIPVIILCSIYASIANAQITVPLKNYFRSLKYIEVTIEGNNCNFLFDTGGGLTLVSPTIVELLNKKAYGNSVGYRMSGERIDTPLCDSVIINIEGQDFYHQEVGVFDIMTLLPEDFKRVDGLISLKTFENSIIGLDLNKNLLTIENDQTAKVKKANMQLIPSRFANGPSGIELNLFLRITEEDKYWWFLFDTGNIAKTKVNKQVVDAWGLVSDSSTTELMHPIHTDIGLIEAPILVDDLIYDGALCFDVISSTEYLISLKDSKVWKTQSK